jgi:hypothetical protein
LHELDNALSSLNINNLEEPSARNLSISDDSPIYEIHHHNNHTPQTMYKNFVQINNQGENSYVLYYQDTLRVANIKKKLWYTTTFENAYFVTHHE